LYSVCRFIPSGLDVASVLGSEKAKNILKKYYSTDYCNYENKQEELKSLVDSYSESNWTKNLYNIWLWLLQPVFKEKPKGYPSWMRSEVWRLKDLITALSSWAELRHDTILYIKQSYTWATSTKLTISPPLKPKYYGYVEPNPEEVKKSLELSSEMMSRLHMISEKELKREALLEEDYEYIRSIGSKFKSILKNLASVLKIKSGYCPEETQCKVKTSLEGKDEALKTSLIADVHTDANSKRVLEVGTGKIDWILVAHRSKDGRIGIAIGPIFSYYEFTWPMDDRLTDEKWRSKILNTMKRPVWYGELGFNMSESSYIIAK